MQSEEQKKIRGRHELVVDMEYHSRATHLLPQAVQVVMEPGRTVIVVKLGTA